MNLPDQKVNSATNSMMDLQPNLAQNLKVECCGKKPGLILEQLRALLVILCVCSCATYDMI